MPAARPRRDALRRDRAVEAGRGALIWSGPHPPANDNRRPLGWAWWAAGVALSAAAAGGTIFALALLTL